MYFETQRDSQRYYHDGDNICLPHFHRSVEFLFVLKGEKQVFVDLMTQYVLRKKDEK